MYLQSVMNNFNMRTTNCDENMRSVLRGGFRGGVRGVRPPPPKIRKAYIMQR